ncbi:hypothetical protein G9Q97_07380 [Cyclobacterium sp. GBPx2]|uniref:Uncharacterized protein n=1 Tax=Cyclobacterium plantarum TaxID=2716263 RepID=A0ABX0H4S3_9BACT|nr:hypothetical protein [Cyclobacterium plantarum]
MQMKSSLPEADRHEESVTHGDDHPSCEDSRSDWHQPGGHPDKPGQVMIIKNQIINR